MKVFCVKQSHMVRKKKLVYRSWKTIDGFANKE